MNPQWLRIFGSRDIGFRSARDIQNIKKEKRNTNMIYVTMHRIQILLLVLTTVSTAFAWITLPSTLSSSCTAILPSRKEANKVVFGQHNARYLFASHHHDSDFDEIVDTVVIGSGVGGLSAASLLTQCLENEKVLVLEQHYEVGGCCHTFTRKGYPFGVGIHYVGEMGGNSKSALPFKRMLDALTPTPIEWSRMTEIYDSVLLGNSTETMRRYDFVSNPTKQVEQIKNYFPNHHKAIDRYYKLVHKARDAAIRGILLKVALPPKVTRFLLKSRIHRLIDKGFHKYSKMTLKEAVESTGPSQELQNVLQYPWGDYGTPPDQASWFMQAMTMTHYQDGAFYPSGGPSEIPKRIIATGIEVRTRCPVKRILVENNEAIGVELMDGKRIGTRRAVVSNAGYRNTFQCLVKNEEMMKDAQKLESSTSGMCLFVGLKGNQEREYNLPRHQLWIYPDNFDMADCLNRIPMNIDENLQPQDIPLVFVGSPSGKDLTWKDTNKTTLEIICTSRWEWFEPFAPSEEVNDAAHDPGGAPGSHGQEYETTKDKLGQLLWTRARQGLMASGAKNLPENLQDVDFVEIGTPLTYGHYLWSERGAFYGLDHNTLRFAPENFYLKLRPQTPIKKLYLTGQDVAVCSMAGAMCGGYFCAGDILGIRNPLKLLSMVEKKKKSGMRGVPE